MSGEPAVNYDRLRFIKLRADGSKLPAQSWGGYDQDFDAADHVHTHDEVEMLPGDNWGIVDINDKDAVSFALLIFDIDVHKAPEDFDADRVGVPTDTLVTRSQNGGFHAYFAVSGAWRGDLSESDFQMAADPGFDVDIRGSIVSHHVVAPAEIPGVGGPYEIVNDEDIASVMDAGDAAERITLDGEPLVEFDPDGGVEGYDFNVPTEAPDDMPTCYHAGLELRKAAPDDHPNTHKVNMLTAACGLAAGYDPETVAGHFCGDWSPHDGGADLSDKEQTEYQVGQIERNGYAPPSEATLRDYGILSEGEHCDEDCPVDYHGPHDDSRPTLDVVEEIDGGRDGQAEAAAVAGEAPAETDGGTATASSPEPSRRRFDEDVRSAIREFQDDVILAKTARHRIAEALVDHYHFIAPESGVRGWREALYVFDDDEGIYEPRGESFIKRKLERVAGDFITNTTASEIVEKVRRMSIRRGDFQPEPNHLVVGNGILDLHTGQLSPYTPNEHHRTKIEVDWNPDAGEPGRIDDFLHDIVDEGDVPTLYRLIAHTLYKEYVGEKAAILIGSGQNGKSVFLDLIEKFVGGYNVTHRELQDFDDDGFAANNLQGKLANLATEIGEQQLNDTTTFKKLTGRDTLDARVKYSSPITFENYATLMFATNEMPIFGQDNHAIWRRWVYVDFPYTFDAADPEAKDPVDKRVLMRELTSDRELEALLLQCQKEIQRWYDGEAWYADAMAPDEVREKMKRAAEPVYNFATACLTVPDDEDEGGRVPKDLVRECYNTYADQEDLPRVPANQFGERLMQLRDFQIESGQQRVDGVRKHVYTGVTLSPRGRQILGVDEPDDDGQGQVGDEYDQPKPIVLDQLREMVDENGNEPVPINGVIWACAGDIGKTTAEKAVEGLKKEGDVLVVDGDRVIPK